MRKLLLTTLLLWGCIHLFASTSLDSLKWLCANTNQPIEKYQLYLDIAQRQKDFDLYEAVNSSEEAVLIGEQLSNDSLQSLAKYYLSFYLFMLERNIESKLIIEDIIPYFETQKDSAKIGALWNRLGKIQTNLGNYQHAIEIHKKAEIILKAINKHSGLGFTYLWLSDLYLERAEYQQSMLMAQNSLEQFTLLGNETLISSALTSLGSIHLQIKDYEEAKHFLAQALSHRTRIKNKQFLIRPLLFLGIIAYETEQIKEAKGYLREALSYIDALGDFPDLFRCYLYFGKIALEEGQQSLALDYLEKAQKNAIEHNNIRNEHLANVDLAIIYQLQNKTELCVNHAKRVYDWAEKQQDHELLFKATDLLASSYAETKAYELAYFYSQKAQIAKENFFNAEKVRNTTTQNSVMRKRIYLYFQSQ